MISHSLSTEIPQWLKKYVESPDLAREMQVGLIRLCIVLYWACTLNAIDRLM